MVAGSACMPAVAGPGCPPALRDRQKIQRKQTYPPAPYFSFCIPGRPFYNVLRFSPFAFAPVAGRTFSPGYLFILDRVLHCRPVLPAYAKEYSIPRGNHSTSIQRSSARGLLIRRPAVFSVNDLQKTCPIINPKPVRGQ